MSCFWKVCTSSFLIGLQIFVIITVCRASTATLMKWRLMHYRGEDILPALRRAGEQLRQNPEDARWVAISGVAFGSLVLDVAAIAIWLN